MSNSQEDSLNENAVFLPVTESCPDFFYSENEREELEILLRSGPEGFYSCSNNCFLSSEEVTQINSWAQNYHSNLDDNGEEHNSKMEGFCSTYFPSHSDFPAPNLDLGWPEKTPWLLRGSASVHTSPPAEGHPPIKEIIRRHLQKASQVIAIVTDRLTDREVINDLLGAASRGVPVYIIINRRSIQESFMLNRLRHPNMRVRVLGGKTFCSRDGRTVVGEMKDKFVLVDLQTVIHGSYSLTWTDAHLHRQLITVLTGPVVDSFDREFRILFADSQPVADSWWGLGTSVKTSQQKIDVSDLRLQKRLSLDSKIDSPPSPPTDDLLDWDVLGVVQKDDGLLSDPFNQHEEIVPKKMPLQNNTPIMDGVTDNGNQYVERRKMSENISPVTPGVPEKMTPFFNTRSTDPTTAEMLKRVEKRIEKTISRQRSIEESTNLYDSNSTSLKHKVTEPTHILPPTQRREHSSRRETILEEQSSKVETNSSVENTTSNKRLIILRVPQTDSSTSLRQDIMRQKNPPARLRAATYSSVSERTQSMMDLSTYNTDTHPDERPVPRFKASYDLDHITPALALMQKRNDDLKPRLFRSQSFMPRERPRSSTYGFNMDWRRSIAEREVDQE